MRREFLSPSICFTIYNGENIWKWVLNLVLKFHDDPMVKKFEIVILLRQVWVYARKRKKYLLFLAKEGVGDIFGQYEIITK